MASKIEWIKITTGMFEDEKIEFIETLPEADAIFKIWIRLLCMAGKCNAGGYIFITENIPYTEEVLSSKFHKSLNTIKLAMETLKRLEMISVDEDGRICVTNWVKHQNVDGMERIKEQTRQRVAAFRERRKIEDQGADGHKKETDEKSPEVALRNVTERYEVTHPSLSYSPSHSSSFSEEKSPKSESETHAERIAGLLLDLHRIYDPRFLPDQAKAAASVERWAKDIEKLIRLDKRTPDEVERILRWAKSDSFWTANIISGSKFREKFPTLLMQASRGRGKGPLPKVDQASTAPRRELTEEERDANRKAAAGAADGLF